MSDVHQNRIKYCFVPLCENNNKKCPDKLFVFVPRTENIRKKWFSVARRADTPNLSTNYYCCQDHFNVSIAFYSCKKLND